MAEEMVSSSEKALILQNSRDEILTKIEEFRMANLSDQEKENLKKKEEALKEEILRKKRCFLYDFTDLCKKFFGVRKEQLKTFSRGELTEIADTIFKRTKNMAAVQKYVFTPLLLLIPIAGWGFIVILACSPSCWDYKRQYSRLKKQYGEDWFPIDVFLND